jgi:hypothetical protein
MSDTQQILTPAVHTASVKSKNDKNTRAQPQQNWNDAAAHTATVESDDLLSGEPSQILRPTTSSVCSRDVSAILQRQSPFSQLGARSALFPAILPSFAGKNFARVPTRGAVQTKLTVGAAHDPSEEEADNVAEQVMRMSAPVSAAPGGGADVPDPSENSIQRTPEEDEIQTKPLAATIRPFVQRTIPKSEDEAVQHAAEEEDELQTKRVSAADSFEVGSDFENRVAGSSSGGSPLPDETRAFMEPRFGMDFSGVRLHSGGEATDLNRSVSARAFTLGRDIYLGEGQTNVASDGGKRLLAHELTHVVQQSGANQLRRKAQDELAQVNIETPSSGIAQPGKPAEAPQAEIAQPGKPAEAPQAEIAQPGKPAQAPQAEIASAPQVDKTNQTKANKPGEAGDAQASVGEQPPVSNPAATNQLAGAASETSQAQSPGEVLPTQPPALEQTPIDQKTTQLPEDETKPADTPATAEGINKEKSRIQAEEFPFQPVQDEPAPAAQLSELVPVAAAGTPEQPAPTGEAATTSTPAQTETPQPQSATEPVAEASTQVPEPIAAPSPEAALPTETVAEEDRIQRAPVEDETTQPGPVTPDLERRIQTMHSGGQSLPESERAFFEPRLGHDFSQVRVHADGEAADLSRQVSARAFTLGTDIAFGAGEYAPGSAEGRHLLANELTHVVQQTGTSATRVQRASRRSSSSSSKSPASSTGNASNQPSLLDLLRARMEAVLNSVRGAADREASGIEGQAGSEGASVQGESNTRAIGIESGATTQSINVETQSTTTATGIESESVTQAITTEGQSVSNVTAIEGQATGEATAVEGEATAEAATVQGQAASDGTSLTSQGDAKIAADQSGMAGLESEAHGSLATIQGQAVADGANAEGRAVEATGELRGNYAAIEAEAKAAQPDLLAQANAMMDRLKSSAQGTLNAANPTCGADLAPLEGDKAALEVRAQGMLAQLEAMLGPFLINLDGLWDKLKQIASAIWDRIKQQVLDAWEALKNLGSSIWKNLQNAWAALKSMANALWQGLVNTSSAVLSNLWNLAQNLWNGLKDRVSGIVSTLKAGVMAAWTGLQTMASNIWNGITARTGSAITTVKNLAASAWDGLKSLSGSAWSALQGRGTVAQNGVNSRTDSAAGSVQGMAGEFLDKIGGILSGLRNRAGGALGNLKATVSGALSTLKTRAGDAVTGLKARVGAAVAALQRRSSTAIAAFKSRAATATATLKSRGLAAWAALQKRAGSALATLKRTGSTAWNGLRSIWDWLKSRVQIAWAAIQNKAGALWAAFQNKLSAIWASLQSIWDKIKQKGSAAWAELQSRWNNLKNHLEWPFIKSGWLGIIGLAKALWGRARGASKEEWSGITQEANQLAAARIQLKGRGNGSGEARDPVMIQRQLGEGQSLHDGVRSSMERAFGESLAGVQIHTDSNAARLARQFDARAFTVGNHIAFDAGEYRPGTLIGDALIAHEVAHTVQQRGATADTAAKGYEPEESATELDADHAAIGAVASKWLGTRDILSRLPMEALPRLRTGLGLRRCTVPKSGVQVTIGAIPVEIPPDVATPGDVTIVLPPPTPPSTPAPIPAPPPPTPGSTPTPTSPPKITMSVYGGGGDKGNADVQPGMLQGNGVVNLTGTAVTTSAGTPLNLFASLGPELLTTSSAFAVRGRLKTDLQFMADHGINYNAAKSRIQLAPDDQKVEALADQNLLRNLKKAFGSGLGSLFGGWDDFAKTVELLGKSAPTAGTLLADPTVSAALLNAFNASNPGVTSPPFPFSSAPIGSPCNPWPPQPTTGVHEEGGWIYLNLITNQLTTQAAAAGGQAFIIPILPPIVDDSIVVGAYHTHPNVGPCWGALTPSNEDTSLANLIGVPFLIIGAFPTVNDTQTTSTGPNQRLHLAGSQGLPGSDGGTAPQATVDGSYDEV